MNKALALCFTILLYGCSPSIPDDPLVRSLVVIMESRLPPHADGRSTDVTGDVCPVVSADKLDGIVGLKIGDNTISDGVITGMADVEDGSRQWLVTRAEYFRWSQSLWIVIEPSGKCFAKVIFERFVGFG